MRTTTPDNLWAMTQPFLYGLAGNHDFTDPKSLGKNVFTNAFPLALAQYLDQEKELKIPVISASVNQAGAIHTKHVLTPWGDVINADPATARFLFETVFDQYNQYTHKSANKSDAVVVNAAGGHRRALEIKLVVVPTSGTAKLPRDKQSCELVVRPPSIEQLAFSIAHSFGAKRRYEIQEILTEALSHPFDFDWENSRYMVGKVSLFINAAEALIKAGLEAQTPLVLIAVWRTEGQSPRLDEHAFDVFAATDFAFLELFLSAARRKSKNGKITRPQRSLVWLVHSLWQYGMQNSLNFARTHEKLTYGTQSDKAGAFTNDLTRDFMGSPEFIYPRVTREEATKVVTPEALAELMPERRLDQALWIQGLMNSESN
ncbi:HindVP family restriction endonuclease [Corynebacterium sp. LK10]|nr:HindVP family restriction endonuclease [Corynebacterium sp. LK10]